MFKCKKGVYTENPTHPDLVLDIFQLPHRLDAKIYDMLISTIDRGIGFYEIRKRTAFFELFSPLTWIAFIFRIPLIIIQRAGLSSEEEGPTQILQFYKWVVRFVILIILILIAKMLGIADLFVSVIGFFK